MALTLIYGGVGDPGGGNTTDDLDAFGGIAIPTTNSVLRAPSHRVRRVGRYDYDGDRGKDTQKYGSTKERENEQGDQESATALSHLLSVNRYFSLVSTGCRRRHADRLREPDSTTLRYLQIGPEVERIR